MFFLFLIPLYTVSAQVCISNYDCASNLQCIPSTDGLKRCTSEVGNGAQPDRYPIIECFIDSDCSSGQVCVLTNNGNRMCHNRSQELTCTTDRDCGPGAVCNPQGQGKRCQIAAGGNFGKLAGLGGSCRRDADCEDSLSCVDRNGVLSCSIVSGGTVTPLLCSTSRDCPNNQECIYRYSTKTLECMMMGEPVPTGGIVTPPPVVGGYVGNSAFFDQRVRPDSVPTGGVVTPRPVAGGYVGDSASFGPDSVPAGGIVTPRPVASGYVGDSASSDQDLRPQGTSAQFEEIQLSQDEKAQMFENNVTLIPTYEVMRTPAEVPRQALIDPAALPCDYDYQCRMGEACTGLLQMVDRNVTVCQYDVTKPNRSCIYHSDCLHGQRCEQVSNEELFICRASPAATQGDLPCVFDYECSGGEKCVNVSNSTTRLFRCRTPQFADPRRNQRCYTNADCPFQQVCRHVAEVSMCVDIGSTVSTVASQDIQKKIVDFVQNLLFARY